MDFNSTVVMALCPEFRVSICENLTTVDAQQWDALVGHDDPFTEHAFLSALEQSGCLHARTGWYPCHLLVLDDADTLRGALPLYVKENSFGEYIFDWGWAEAAMAAGIPYYPKLVTAVPFTPVAGHRLLVEQDEKQTEIAALLISAARQLADHAQVSSIHALFVSADEQAAFAEHEFLPRLSFQFRWHNRGYESFDHYLASFRSTARKNVRRERQRVTDSGLSVSMCTGADMRGEDWDALYRFYRDTTERKWGQRYLTRRFFEILRHTMAHRVYVALARDGSRTIAGALFLSKGQSLYGRYWGCVDTFDALHFELCYYQPIDLCIKHGLQRFEAGAQGQHKLKRGLLPSPVFSAHWLRPPDLHQAVKRHLASERTAIVHEMTRLTNRSPFRKPPTND